jgi:hypothetical protein
MQLAKLIMAIPVSCVAHVRNPGAMAKRPILPTLRQVQDDWQRPATQEARALEEKDLTEKQREWLALSRKIGPGATTKSEREKLEKAYAAMLPKEQQDLYSFIIDTYGKKEGDEASSSSEPNDPIAAMEKVAWKAPSDPLKAALSKVQHAKPWSTRDKS